MLIKWTLLLLYADMLLCLPWLQFRTLADDFRCGQRNIKSTANYRQKRLSIVVNGHSTAHSSNVAVVMFWSVFCARSFIWCTQAHTQTHTHTRSNLYPQLSKPPHILLWRTCVCSIYRASLHTRTHTHTRMAVVSVNL